MASSSLNSALMKAIQRLLRNQIGSEAKVRQVVSVSGGSINQTCQVILADGSSCFCKWNSGCPGDFFQSEAAGLERLAEVGTIAVPKTLGWQESTGTEETSFLLLEWIETSPPAAGFQELFGRKLAVLHRAGEGADFGLNQDNYCGRTPQINSPSQDWVSFWRNCRLVPQLTWARQKKLTDSKMDRLADRLLDRLGEYLEEPDEAPTLLHGDLWSGNYMVNGGGDPVLIDPAIYYGRREADLAMTRLFGGFSESFYAAYQEEWPLEKGSSTRIELYQLYHLLNHLNLFGSSYHASCLQILERYA